MAKANELEESLEKYVSGFICQTGQHPDIVIVPSLKLETILSIHYINKGNFRYNSNGCLFFRGIRVVVDCDGEKIICALSDRRRIRK